MLSNIFATAHHSLVRAQDSVQHLDDYSCWKDPLNEGDTAQWAAGLMYAYTKQESDIRDYLVGCA